MSACRRVGVGCALEANWAHGRVRTGAWQPATGRPVARKLDGFGKWPLSGNGREADKETMQDGRSCPIGREGEGVRERGRERMEAGEESMRMRRGHGPWNEGLERLGDGEH